MKLSNEEKRQANNFHGELKTNITITGKIGSGASIEIYHTSNKKKPDLEPQKLIFLYHDIVDKMIIIQREEKSEFQYDLKNIVITIPKNIIINFKKCQGDIAVENISGAINFNEHLGSIKLSGLNGDLKIDSFGGEVNIEDSHLFSNIYLKNDNLKVKNVHGENKITILGGDLFINNFEGIIFSLFRTGKKGECCAVIKYYSFHKCINFLRPSYCGVVLPLVWWF